jgi:hypothetical protein
MFGGSGDRLVEFQHGRSVICNGDSRLLTVIGEIQDNRFYETTLRIVFAKSFRQESQRTVL